MSFKVEVTTDSSGCWDSNALRFATKKQAEAYAVDLMRRWFLVRDTRVVRSRDVVNYEWVEGTLQAVDYDPTPSVKIA